MINKPVRAGGSASYAFADRVPESRAMADSLQAHMARVWANEIDPQANRNVLVFHGMGGQGKTELSLRLERWITGRLSDHPEWGDPPLRPSQPLVVRWDLHNLKGGLDIPGLLIALRFGLSAGLSRWKVFDLAFAAYLSSVRPHEQVELNRLGHQRDDLLGVLCAVANDFGAANLITQLSTAAIRVLTDRAIVSFAEWQGNRQHPNLAQTLDRCRSLGAGQLAPELAAEVVWLLTEQIDALPPRERPPVVVFVETFERLQEPGHVRAEHDLNLLMAHLPYALFVVTGRNRLNWHEFRDGLDVCGPQVWPGLRPDCAVDPRQHQLGRLERSDAAELLGGRRDVHGWDLDDSLLNRVVDRTDGWPLHIDTVTKVAQQRTTNGAPLTPEVLLGGMPDLVARLIEDMGPEEASAFHAMCLTSAFDDELVKAVAQVDSGVVAACRAKAVVEPNNSLRYPWMVHDTIRQLVKKAGVRVQPHWLLRDWQDAARRGQEEMRRRFESATAADDDAAAVAALAMAISIGVEYDVHDQWVTEAVRMGPTIVGLAPHIPAVSNQHTDSDAVALAQLVHAMSRSRDPESLDVLRGIFEGDTGIAEQAGRWRAYTLRGTYQRRDEALLQFADNLRRFPVHRFPASRISRNQYAVTLYSMRRFRDALAYRQAHGLDAEQTRANIKRLAGHNEPVDIAARLSRIASTQSERFRIELRCDLLGSLVRFGPVPDELVTRYQIRGANLGQKAREGQMVALRALAALADEEPFAEQLAILDRLQQDALFVSESRVRLRALRAIATGAEPDRAAVLPLLERIPALRPAGWIQAEAYLALLGMHLPPVETQWPEGEDEASVFARRQQIGMRFIERAKQGDIIKPLAQIPDWPESEHW